MKETLLTMALLLGAFLDRWAYQPVGSLSTVQFSVRNLGFKVTGSFGGVEGRVVFDPAEPASGVFDVTVDAGSVNSDNGMRDDHLRGESFFDVGHYPRIRLVSGKIGFYRNGSYLFTGTLTIKGHSKAVAFPFSASVVDGGYRFKGSFAIDRRDFGVGGTSTISDGVEVNLDVTVK